MPNLDLTGIIAEARTEPLHVTIGDDLSVDFMSASALPVEALEVISEAVERMTEADRTGRDAVTVSLRAMREITECALSPVDRDRWAAARVPAMAQLEVLRALGDFYDGIGTPGEGRASVTS